MSIAILSVDFGRYHKPSPLPTQRGVAEAIMVTDAPQPVPGWRNVTASLDANHRMASKIVKCTPENFTESEIVIWVDAQFIIRSEMFAQHCVAHLGDGEIAVLRHPWRKGLVDEALAGCGPQGRGRFRGQDTVGQAKHYLSLGHPPDWGLFWTMIVVRRMTESVRAFGKAWLEEQRRWSTHDQISFPHICRTVLGRPRELPYPLQFGLLPGYPPPKPGPRKTPPRKSRSPRPRGKNRKPPW